MTDRLSSYGYAFQIKVITSLLTDKSFLEQISDICCRNDLSTSNDVITFI